MIHRLSFEPQRQKTYLQTVASSEDSGQTEHLHSLIGSFTGRLCDIQGCNASSSGQRRLWSDCADAQADLRWAHMSKGTFSHVAVRFYIRAISWNSLGYHKQVSSVFVPRTLKKLRGWVYIAFALFVRSITALYFEYTTSKNAFWLGLRERE